MEIRDRVRELRRVKAKDLVPNPKNWRVHPKAQASALRGLLAEVGYADALIARELPDGKLQLIDGHLRAETTPNAMVPVLLLDVTEEEADKLLLTLDPLAGMAEADAGRIKAGARPDSAANPGRRISFRGRNSQPARSAQNSRMAAGDESVAGRLRVLSRHYPAEPVPDPDSVNPAADASLRSSPPPDSCLFWTYEIWLPASVSMAKALS
jgi:hypothetical protein